MGGDEPSMVKRVAVAPASFPTRVGMNRNTHDFGCERRRLPHTHGDEPGIIGVTGVTAGYSPHEWG